MQFPLFTFQFSKNAGQTLIEVIIAIGLVVLVLLTLVSALTLAVRNNQFAKDQVLARNRSREALEWLRSMRDQMGFDAFYSMVQSDSPPVVYCLATLPSTTAGAIALGNQVCLPTDLVSGTKYVRSMTLTTPSVDEVDATVAVTWTDGGKTHQSQSTLYLKRWL